MTKKKRPRGRPKLKPKERGIYQLTFFKYFNKKEPTNDKRN